MAQNRKSFGYPLRSTSTMAAPSALVLKCPQCGEVVPHRVLRGKIGGNDEIVFEGVVRCSKCDAISNVVTREPKPISVPFCRVLARSLREDLPRVLTGRRCVRGRGT